MAMRSFPIWRAQQLDDLRMSDNATMVGLSNCSATFRAAPGLAMGVITYLAPTIREMTSSRSWRLENSFSGHAEVRIRAGYPYIVKTDVIRPNYLFVDVSPLA